ncbi:MAG: hypothetical protein EYC70_00915 [Planctomycetota bacterium]|nr:MAG: hypothetical protein EYC70_00915 [Planctomycetota bacterium]
MSGRQTLYILLALTALALVARLYVGHLHGKYRDALASHPDDLRSVAEVSGDLSARLANFSVSDNEQDFNTHFASQAADAGMGTVVVKSKTRAERGYDDRVFTMDFAGDSARFSRQQLTVFMYESEREKPRMRTTRLSFQAASPDGRAARPGADREDLWRVNGLEFTQRTPKTEQK